MRLTAWNRPLVPLYIARGRPHVFLSIYLSVRLCSPPMGRSRLGFAHRLQWQTNGLRERPDFQRISTANILRTCMHTRIKYIPVGWPRPGFAHGLHWQANGLRDGVDFQRIRITNIVRTCLHARIKYMQIRERRSARPSK